MKLLLNINKAELKKQFRLTNAEIITVEHTISGLTRKQIAGLLNVSLHTVKSHLESAYPKFKVHNKIEVVLKFIDINMLLLLITYITQNILLACYEAYAIEIINMNCFNLHFELYEVAVRCIMYLFSQVSIFKVQC